MKAAKVPGWKRMSKATCIAGMALCLFLLSPLAFRLFVEYHLGEFLYIRTPTNSNNYRPGILQVLLGIHDANDKYEFHLKTLEFIGAIQHKTFVFTAVSYTKESSKRILQGAWFNFPDVVNYSLSCYDTNHPFYGVKPVTLEVWDRPEAFIRWEAFYHSNNHQP